MALAGRQLVLTTSPDDTTYNNIKGINSLGDKENGDSLEITAFGDTAKKFIMGLDTFTFDLKGTWEPTDTNGQVALRTAYRSKTTVWVKALYDGTAGVKGQCLVTSFEREVGVGGTVDVTYSLQGTGAVVDV